MTLAPGAADARDTLVVVGGHARVDADAVAAAAVRLGGAAAALRWAAGGCWAASSDLDRSEWAPAPLGADPGGAGPGAFGARRETAALAGDACARLNRLAVACEVAGERLLRAAGLYVQAESVAERLVGGAVAVGLGGAAVAVAAAAGSRARTGAEAPGLPGPNVAVSPACTVAALGPFGAAARAFAPYADEAVAGLSLGVAAGAPVRSRLDLGVAGGARVLASVVHELLPRTRVRVLPAPPLAGGRPAWADVPSSTVAEALARTADLYPWGSGVAGRDVPGAVQATVGVERVEHADGRVSWTVLVPGTQGVVSPVHPFDGVTDLDLMAHEAAEVTAAVEEALAQAGAAPDEPVVLVGHSLGGIAAMALASSPGFAAKHRLGGVVTAGSPTATFTAPPGVPVLHLENDEELVSLLDGRSTAENPRTRDRVTVGRSLRASPDPADVAASAGMAAAHGMPTHLRTLRLAREAGSAPVAGVVTGLERLLTGERATTRFYVARRVPHADHPAGPIVLAPGEEPVSRASWGRALR